MDETGLTESLEPLSSSRLLHSEENAHRPIHGTVTYIPPQMKRYTQKHTSYIFELQIHHVECPSINIPEGHFIPECVRCKTTPINPPSDDIKRWECPVCHSLNPDVQSNYYPKLSSYKIPVLNKGSGPLFLFIIQSSRYFHENSVVSSILQTIDNSDLDFDIALAAIDEHLTIFDLNKGSCQTFIESAPAIVPSAPKNIANCSNCLSSFQPSDVINTDKHLNEILSVIPSRHICLCLFASDYENLTTETLSLIHNKSINLVLFAPSTYRFLHISRLCYRIYSVDPKYPRLFASYLSSFLNQSHLFDVKIAIHSSTPVTRIAFGRQNIESSQVSVLYMDSQSSFMFMVEPPKRTSLFIQINCSTQSSITVINYEVARDGELDEYDGVLFSAWVARQAALRCFFDSLGNTYRLFRKQFLDLIDEWTSDGQYRRIVPDCYRDTPVLIYGLLTGDLFSKDSNVQLTTTVSFLTLGSELIRRELYPLLITSDLDNYNRLLKSAISDAHLLVFMKANTGYAISTRVNEYREDIQRIEQRYRTPIISIEDPQEADCFFVEDRMSGFREFCRSLEVEINGRRF